MKSILFILLLCTSGSLIHAQSMFQHLYKQPDSGTVLQTFDAKQTPDGGYVITGLASQGTTNIYHPFIMKTDCHGDLQWEQYFGITQSIANVNARVIITQDSQLVMINNLGGYQDYNGFAVRLTMQGNILWQQLYNLSSSSDAFNDVKELPNGQLLFTGSNKTTSDVSLVKTDASGNLLWHKSYGNSGQYDDGYALTVLQDGNYLITGRYISMGTFNALLMKTDTTGNVLWLKCYGDSNQHMNGFDVKELASGELVMVGSTTLLKPSFQSYSDNFIMKLNAQGDTLWTKIFYGTPDQFENVSSLEIDSQGNFLLGVSTASYPTSGFVPNKNALVKFDAGGNLVFAKIYNTGASHYTRINRCMDGTILLSAFSNKYGGPIGFQTLLMKLNANYESGCFEQDVTAQTIVSSKQFKITQPLPLLSSGGSVSANSSTFNTNIEDSVLCETFPVVQASFTYTDTCLNDVTSFEAQLSQATWFHWNFGDGSTADLPVVGHTFAQAGEYDVTLYVGNGCDVDSITQHIKILAPISGLNIGSDTTLCEGKSIVLQSNISGYPTYWNIGDSSSSITVSTPGVYELTLNTGACGLIHDTIAVYTKSCLSNDEYCGLFMPNAFSPNGDQVNDQIYPIVTDPQFELVLFEIRNRWGQIVYRSSDIHEKWDGTLHGQAAASDTYYYFIRMKCNGEVKIMKGDILLIR